MTRVLNHVRSNLVAYIALFVALGGTSYAAVSISGSQIRNRTINAVKLNPDTISASIRAWVIVDAGADSASVGASSNRVQVRATSTGETITWPHLRFARNCMASVTPQFTVPSGPYGAVSTQFDAAHARLTVYGFGPDKLGRPQSAAVMVICP